MKSKIILLLVLICSQFYLKAQSQRILYLFPDSVELRLNSYILDFNKKQPGQQLYFLLKKDTSGVYNLTVIPFQPGTESDVLSWVKTTNRYALINRESYPVLFDYDFTFSTSNPGDIGEMGHREGSIRKMYLIAHRYTIYFKMNGSILKEESW